MTKRLVAKTGEYEKDGQTKGRYTEVGVILSNNNGEYMLLDPCVNLAGVLAKQNAMAATKNQQSRDSVMVSIFDNNNQRQGGQGGGYDQGSQGGYGDPSPVRSTMDDDEIPF